MLAVSHLVSATDVESPADFEQLTWRLKAGIIQKPVSYSKQHGCLYAYGSTRDRITGNFHWMWNVCGTSAERLRNVCGTSAESLGFH